MSTSIRSAFGAASVRIDARRSMATTVPAAQAFPSDRKMQATRNQEAARRDAEVQEATAMGRCPSIITPSRRDGDRQTARVCNQEATLLGYCRHHFLWDAGRMHRRKSLFSHRAIPLPAMSSKQLRAFLQSPVTADLDELMDRLNKADPANPVKPNPVHVKSRG